MTDRPAVFSGVFVDMKFMHGLKCARVHIDIPLEAANSFLKAFGAPDKANPTPVALARLLNESAPSGADPIQPHSPSPEDKPRTPFRELPRSQQAAIKCHDRAFQEWLQVYERPDSDDLPGIADIMLKTMLHIDSKRELDTNPEKAAAWDAALASFDYRDRAP